MCRISYNFWPPWFLSFARPNGRQGPIKSSNLRSPHPTPTPPKGPGFWGFPDPKGGFFKSDCIHPQTIETTTILPKTQTRLTPTDQNTTRSTTGPPSGFGPTKPPSDPIDHHRSSMKPPMTPKKGQKTPLRNGFFGWFQPNAGRLQKNTPFLRFFA